jgi:hypothetical protein
MNECTVCKGKGMYIEIWKVEGTKKEILVECVFCEGGEIEREVE